MSGLWLLGWGTKVERGFCTVYFGDPDFKFATLNKWKTKEFQGRVENSTEKDRFGPEIPICCNFKHYFSPQDKESDTLQLSKKKKKPTPFSFLFLPSEQRYRYKLLLQPGLMGEIM